MMEDRGKSISGERFGKLVALYPHSRDKRNKVKYFCVCDCGNTTVSYKFCLTSGKAMSCGCVSAEKARIRCAEMSKEERLKTFSHPTHGLSKTKEFKAWADAKSRCMNKQNAWYESYGGRGITFSEDWLISFETFYSDMGQCPEGYSLDRIDVNKGYCKENCRWASAKQQQRNRTDTEWVDSPLGKHPIADVAEMLGLTTSCLKHRLTVGWDWDRIINTPSQRKSKGKKNDK